MPRGAKQQSRFNPFASPTEAEEETNSPPIASEIESEIVEHPHESMPQVAQAVDSQESTQESDNMTATAEAPTDVADIFDFSFTPVAGRGRKPNPNRYMDVIKSMQFGQQKGVVVRDAEDADKQRILLRRAGKENECSVITSLVTHEGKQILGFQKIERIARKQMTEEEKAARKAAKAAEAAKAGTPAAPAPAPTPTESAADLAANGFTS